MKLLLNLVISTLAVLISAYIFPGVHIEGLLAAGVFAIVLGILNMFLAPILKILTLPITVLTLGLFSLIVNTIIVLLTDYIVPGFAIDTFVTALLFSIVLSFVNSFLSYLAK